MTTNDIWNDDEFNESEVVYSPISRATYIFNEFMKGITDRRRSYSRIPGRITPVLALINELNGPFKRYPDPGRLATAEMVIFIHKLLSYLDRSARHRNNFRTARAVLILHDKFTRRDFNFKLDFTLRSEYLTNVNYWRNLKNRLPTSITPLSYPHRYGKILFIYKLCAKLVNFSVTPRPECINSGVTIRDSVAEEKSNLYGKYFAYGVIASIIYFISATDPDRISFTSESRFISVASLRKKSKKIKMNKNLPQKKQKINVIRYLV